MGLKSLLSSGSELGHTWSTEEGGGRRERGRGRRKEVKREGGEEGGGEDEGEGRMEEKRGEE